MLINISNEEQELRLHFLQLSENAHAVSSTKKSRKLMMYVIAGTQGGLTTPTTQYTQQAFIIWILINSRLFRASFTSSIPHCSAS